MFEDRRREQRVRDMCQFMQQIADLQIGRDDHVLFETASDCASEVTLMCDTMIKHPSVKHVPSWQGEGAKKSHMGWITTCPCIDKELCNVRGTSARRGHDRRIADTRWSESILKALGRWNASAVYALDEHEDPDEKMIPDDQEIQRIRNQEAAEAGSGQPPVEHVRKPRGEHGITFEVPAGRRVSEAIRKGLVKAHCNLGHPSREDLTRFLKLGGARREVLEAVGWMRCVTCAHARRPSTHRTTNIPPCQAGDEVQLDCICIHDGQKQAYWFLSIIDRATSYHITHLKSCTAHLTADGPDGFG